MTLLRLDTVSKKYGGLAALDGVSFDVAEGEIVAVIGPNGAGKTTLFNVISGFTPPTAGRIEYRGAPIAGQPPYRVAELGIARTFQLTRLFKNMTARDNIAAGTHLRTKGGAFVALLRPGWVRRQEVEVAEKSAELLDLVGLAGKADVPAGALTYGQQRRLEIARALAGAPKLLLLDEPAASLTPQETAELDALMRTINRSGVTILLIEHDVGLVMRIATTVAVLDFGRRIAHGRPGDVARDPAVLAAYLGTSDEAVNG